MTPLTRAAWGDDGLPADCRDADPNTFPGAAEACDNVDNDCDGAREDRGPLAPDSSVYFSASLDNGTCGIYRADPVTPPGDNCPLAYNPDQADADADGLGDACDP